MSVSLENIVDVSVEVSNPSAISSDFNLGLLIGNTKPTAGTKVKVYDSATYQTTMVSDGFATTSNEYKKAVVYFSQNPKSSKLAVGFIDTSTDETPQDALTAIRVLNDKFYSVFFADKREDEEIKAIAAAVEGFDIPTVYYFATDDDKCIQTSQENVIKDIQTAKYKRTFGFYSKDVNLDAAVVGMVSGLNSMETNSAYTAAYKSLVGVTASDLDDTQLSALIGYNGNAYTVFGNKYSFTYPCISGGSYHVDEIYLIDAAKYLIQQYAVAGLVSQKKVPQTEDGLALIATFISNACTELSRIGLIASGIWKGEDVMNLKNGDAIDGGFYVQYDSIASQSQSERASRTSPPFYVALLSSGAIEHIVVKVYVNR